MKAPVLDVSNYRKEYRGKVAVRDLSSEIEWAKVSLVTAEDYERACVAKGRPAPAGFDHRTLRKGGRGQQGKGGRQAEHHCRASSILRRISRIASPSPTNTDSAIRKWPMFNSLIWGSAAMGPTVSKVSPWPA